MTKSMHQILVIEDEPGIRKVLYAALGACDLDLGGFGSAQELLDAWRPEHPDIIFLDIALDRSDAVDVIRALATRKYRGAVQLMSGRDRTLLEQVRHVGDQHGLTMLPPLQKPFRAMQVQARSPVSFSARPSQCSAVSKSRRSAAISLRSA